MALDDFDLAQLLKRMGIFGDAPAPQAPAWMTSPHQTISAPGEATGAIPQVGGQPWYASQHAEPVGPAAGFGDEPQNDEFAKFLSEGHEGIQGPRMEDIQIQQGPAPHYSVGVGAPQMPLGVEVGTPKFDDMQLEGPDDPVTRKRKAALASIGGP